MKHMLAKFFFNHVFLYYFTTSLTYLYYIFSLFSRIFEWGKTKHGVKIRLFQLVIQYSINHILEVTPKHIPECKFCSTAFFPLIRPC